MAELKIKLSDKALSLIAQLQKEIFNRRRKTEQDGQLGSEIKNSSIKSPALDELFTSLKEEINEFYSNDFELWEKAS